jgi:hypothetical protein
MSRDNLELVRSIYADWDQGEFGRVAWADPEIEYVIADGLSPGISKGVPAMAQAWQSFVTAWTDFRTELDECRELDEERVLALHHFYGRGRSSGLEVGPTRSSGACVFHVRAGRVTKLLLYTTREGAFADLGLVS